MEPFLHHHIVPGFLQKRTIFFTYTHTHKKLSRGFKLCEKIKNRKWKFLQFYNVFKEQYCIGTWNVSSMNQGKLDMVKQEMERVNIDILGTSKLQWTGMGEFNSDDNYIFYCRQESLRRNGVAIMVNKRV